MPDAWPWWSGTSSTASCRPFRRPRAEVGLLLDRKWAKTPARGARLNTVRTVTRQAPGVARWRRSKALRRVSERISRIVLSFPVVAPLLLILLAILLAALIGRWPAVMPWTAFIPVIVLAGLFLAPRWLALVLLVTGGL